MNLPKASVEAMGFGRDEDGWERNEWRVTLSYDGRRMVTKYFTGTGIMHRPEARDVLSSLFADADSIEYDGVDEWIREMGVEIESVDDVRRYERMYDEIEKQTERLHNLLAADYDAIHEEVGDE